jgi:hypothetical protein
VNPAMMLQSFFLIQNNFFQFVSMALAVAVAYVTLDMSSLNQIKMKNVNNVTQSLIML